MTNNCAANTTLTGTTGTGNFVGSTNPAINNVSLGYTTTATAAGTTVLVVGSTYQQFFTGSTTQTVTLPVTSTLVLGQSFEVVNTSSGVVTVQSSGANAIQAMAANTTLIVTCILTSGTSAASWQIVSYGSVTGSYLPISGGTLTGNIAFNPTTDGITGTTTNDNAAAGSVGEFSSSVIPGASSVAILSSAATNLTSLSLTAGDWEVWGNITFAVTNNAISQGYAWCSTTSATLPDPSLYTGATLTSTVFQGMGITAARIRVSISMTTTVYVSGYLSFTLGTASMSGGIFARRMR